MIFDLSTEEGMKAAKETAKYMYGGGQFGIAGLLASSITDFFSSDKIIKEQRKDAVELIKAGRINNADELEITLAQDAGINIQAELEDIPVKAMIGKSGKMKIKVKYK